MITQGRIAEGAPFLLYVTRSKMISGSKSVRLRAAVLVLVLLLAAERPLAAYTDPGSGALLWQILVAGFIGAMFYVRKFTKWFRGKTRDTKD
jgi:hypothetical protein